MLANGNNHYVFNCQFAPKSQWPDKRKTLLRFQTLARHLPTGKRGTSRNHHVHATFGHRSTGTDTGCRLTPALS